MNSTIVSKNVKRLFKYSKKYKRQIFNIYLLTFFSYLLLVANPFILRFLIDNVITAERFSLIPSVMAIFLTIIIGQFLIGLATDYYSNMYQISVTKKEQIILYNKIQKIPFLYSDKTLLGDFLTRIVSDVSEVANFLILTKPSIYLNLLQLALILTVLFLFSWHLTIVVLATIPFYYLILNKFSKNFQQSSSEERKEYSNVMENLREKIESINTVKILTKESFFQQKVSERTENWKNSMKKYVRDFLKLDQGIYLIISITTPLILGVGGYLMMSNILTIGTLLAFYQFSTWLFVPLKNINEQLAQLQRADTLSQRFFEILDLPEEESDGIYSFPKNYDIKYNKVSFTYKDELVLKDINLYIDKNEKIAIVGTSGSGKSTMMNLLVRLYDPTSGEILLEDKNLKEYNLQEIREHIKLVRGNDPLFNMSVKENIMLGDEFSDQEFNKAVKKAKVDKFINLLDEGYDTMVGERGSKLSDGQRQRVAIARALIREPKVLILDEATSGVDSQTEEEIFEELKEYDMTLIIISHRLSTIRKADKVVVLKDGEIIGEGTHNELIESSPVYKEIIESQLVV